MDWRVVLQENLFFAVFPSVCEDQYRLMAFRALVVGSWCIIKLECRILGGGKTHTFIILAYSNFIMHKLMKNQDV